MLMNNYTHLTRLERENILLMLANGQKITDIARQLGRNKSTIYLK